MSYDIGIIGLGVMGSNFAKNLINCNVSVSAFDTNVSKAEATFRDYNSKHIKINKSIKEMCENLKMPKKVLLIVPAGKIVDDVLDELKNHLSAHDIIVDMGNSSHLDTINREVKMNAHNIHYLGCGFSGGEFGALNGPSLMLSGDYNAYKEVYTFLSKTVAEDKYGNPSIGYMGKSGAGHFVKLVHNGIEYAELQLISEIYGFLKNKLNMDNLEISNVFKGISEGVLQSYLFDLAIRILEFEDPEKPDEYLLNRIKGNVQQKGTGFMISLESIKLKAVTPSIITSLLVRFMSNEKPLFSEVNTSNKNKLHLEINDFKNILKDSVMMIKYLLYHQGFDLLKKSNEHYKWNISIKEAINVWKKGSILESEFLYELDKYDIDSKNILEHEEANTLVKDLSDSLIEVVKIMTNLEAFCPVVSTTYQYWLSMTAENSSLNIIQGMRDAFGSHTFELKDKEGNYHANWFAEEDQEKKIIKK